MLAATMLAAVHGAPTWAQETSGRDGDSATGDIIVTARRVEERLQDVPISITVYSQEALANRNIVTPADLGTYTPSLAVNQRFGPEKASFAIRGFTQEANTSPSVGVYFADVVAARSQTGTTSGNGAGAGSLFDLQNVQVLKGPQGTLFGRNTTGGAILLVPQKPTDRLEGWVEGSAGDYDMWRLQAVLNVPLADTFKVRLGFDRNKRDGYMINHAAVGAKTLADVNYFSARLSIVADLTPELENYTVASYSNSFSRGFGSRITHCLSNGMVPGFTLSANQARLAPAACAQIARQNARGDGPYDTENNIPDPGLSIRQWQAINTTTWQASDTLTIKNIVSYTEFREDARFSHSGGNFTYTAPLPAGVPVGALGQPYQYLHLYSAPGQDVAAQSTFTEEFQLQGNTPDGSLVWQAGAYLEVSDPLGWSAGYTPQFIHCPDVSRLVCINSLGNGNISESTSKTRWNNKGFYAQGTYKFTEQLSLTAGIRYTIDKVTGAGKSRRIQFTQGLTPGAVSYVCNDTRIPGPAPDSQKCFREFKQKSERPTWLISLEYKPVDDVMVYAKWARGYRQGGVNMTNVGLETWEPEKVEAYEVGAKTSFHGGAVHGYFNIAGFYNDFSDQQIVANLVAKPNSGLAGGVAIINAGTSRIKGFEADASITLFDDLRFDMGYTYLDTELLSQVQPTLTADSPFERIVPTALVGQPLSYSPKHRLTTTATYTLPLDQSIGNISIGATWVYTDKQYATRADDAFIPIFGRNLGLLPASNVVNLNINWNDVLGQPIDAAFFVTNLTKEVYPVTVAGGLNSTGFENFVMGPPRMWGARLRYTFGK